MRDCWLIYQERSPRAGSSVGAEVHNLAEVWPGFEAVYQNLCFAAFVITGLMTGTISFRWI
jgi:hypothetical protein